MKILAVNPGSTSTKIAVFEDLRPLFEAGVELTDVRRSAFAAVLDQLEMRCALISLALSEAGFAEDAFDAVVGRGGLLAPMPSGTYLVNDAMKD